MLWFLCQHHSVEVWLVGIYPLPDSCNSSLAWCILAPMEPGGNPPVCNPLPVDTRAPNNEIDTVIIIH